MQPLRYSINVTLDGCCDHTAMTPDAELHAHVADIVAQADVLLFGRITYQMMEAAWRPVAEDSGRADWVEDWMVPFAKTIHLAKKYVVSSTLGAVDWNAELIAPAELESAVRALKAEDGRGIYTGGVTLPQALAERGLIDDYEFVVHPRLAGHGRRLFAGLAKPLDLTLVGRQEFSGGAVALRYVPRAID